VMRDLVLTFMAVPEGLSENGPGFQAWDTDEQIVISPMGTTEWALLQKLTAPTRDA